MFHFKDILNRVAHGTSPNSPARNAEPDAAEGFLCPSCMNAFTSQEELQIHYSASHKDIGPPSGPLSSNNEDLTVFQSFHQGVGDRYKQVTVFFHIYQHLQVEGPDLWHAHPDRISSTVDEAKEVYDVNCHGENSSELTIKELMKKLKDLIRQNEMVAEEKRQVEQRAAALAEKVVTLKATADEGESQMAALTNRLALVEAQLAHRENIDDAAVLRQELIQVQRVMDEMTREREMESDQLKRDLQNLQQRYDLLQSECKSSEAIEEEKVKIESLEEALGKKEELVDKFSDEITMLKDTVSTLENELLQKCSVLKEKDCQLENVHKKLEEICSREDEGKMRVAELEQNLADASIALKKHNKEHLQLKQLLESYSEKLKKDEEIISDLQSQVGSNASIISDKNKELMAINEKMEILTSQLKDYTISNEDLRCRNEEHARLLEDKVKLVASLEDREKDIQTTLQKNVAQMDMLNKNYLELMNLFQAQMQSNSKTDSDLEKKLLGQIECAVDILTKKSNQLDNLPLNDTHQIEKQMQDDRGVREEEMIHVLQSQCKEKSDKLLEAERRIETLRSEMEGRTVTEKAKEGEFEAIISSLRFNLQQTKDELSAKMKTINGLEDALMAEKIQVSCKEEELNRVNTMYLFKLKELKEIYMVFAHLKKDLESCKKAVVSLVNEFKCVNQICRNKVVSVSNLIEGLERDSKELILVKQELKVTAQLLEEKKIETEGLMKKLDGEQLRNSELQDANSIKSMEVEELMANIAIEKEKCGNLQCEMDKLLETNSQIKEDLHESENKVRSLTADLLLCEQQKTDTELKNLALENRLEVELNENEMEIEKLVREKELLIEELSEVEEKMKSYEIKYQNEMKEKDEEIELLKNKLSKEEQLKEEMKNNLEEELLAKAALDRDYSQFKVKHESEVARLTENINSLTMELRVKEDSEKMKEKTIDKLQEQISVVKIDFEAERQALLERYIESTKESEHLQSTNNDLRRRLEESQAALHEIGRENQTIQMELAKMYGRKWTEDADVTNCERCSKEFSLRVRKHHCRYCGKIFCNDCSSKMAAIASNKKPVRVCETCYIELVPN